MNAESDDKSRSTRFLLRLSPAEKAAWEQAAKLSDRSLSAWLRHVANASIERSKKRAAT